SSTTNRGIARSSCRSWEMARPMPRAEAAQTGRFNPTNNRSVVDVATDVRAPRNPMADRVAAPGPRLGRGGTVPWDPVPRNLHQADLARCVGLARRIRGLECRMDCDPQSVECAARGDREEST